MARGWGLLVFLVVALGGAAVGGAAGGKRALTPEQKARVKAACVGPYRLMTADDRCVWSCAYGTQPGRTSGKAECVCQAGLSEIGQDRFGRRVCSNDDEREKIQKALAREAAGDLCPEPYHLATDDGRCVWSCSVGTMPENKYPDYECVCKPGLHETGTDEFGRRVCTK